MADELAVLNLVRGNVDGMASPIRFLWPHLLKPLRRLSPSVLDRLVESGIRLQFVLEDDRAAFCRVDPVPGIVTISTGLLTFLWACSHLNITYYPLLQRLDGIGRSIDVDSRDHPALQQAFDLLRWALRLVASNEDPGEWPAELPRPDSSYGAESPVFPSSALSLGSMAFIILHEVAHVLLGHRATRDAERSHAQELEADRSAVLMFIEDAESLPESTIETRRMSVITAMYSLCVCPLVTGRWSTCRHPPGWQRLDAAITALELDDDEPALMFASQLKELYAAFSGRESGGRFEGPSDLMNQFIEQLSGETEAEEKPAREY